MRLLRTTTALAATLLLATGMAGRASASASDESRLLALTNQVRASVGAPPLSLDAGISSIARTWAEQMAASGGISHNHSLSGQVGGWTKIGENVGMGASVDIVHQALVASPVHYTNLTDPAFSVVGIGVVSANGLVWIVEDFEKPAGQPSVRSQSAATGSPTPKPSPSPTTAAPAKPKPAASTPTPTAPAVNEPRVADLGKTVFGVAFNGLRAFQRDLTSR